jgi:putative phosphoribosyl transferase
MTRFKDRDDAGRSLARALFDYRNSDPVVLGIPRGGVPVAYRVASELGMPLDVIIVRKLGVPGQPEVAMGAVGEDGVLIVNQDVLAAVSVSEAELAREVADERREVVDRAGRLRGDAQPQPLTGRTAIIVDDGVATGATTRAACEVARAHGASKVVLAVPVGAADTLAALRTVADDVVCLSVPRHFWAVGEAYEDFSQVPDRDVVAMIERASGEHH